MPVRRARKHAVPSCLAELSPTLLEKLVKRSPDALAHLTCQGRRPVTAEGAALAMVHPPDDGSLSRFIHEIGMIAELATDHYRELVLKYLGTSLTAAGGTHTNADLAAMLLLEHPSNFQRAYVERRIDEHTSLVSYFPVDESVPVIRTSPVQVVEGMSRQIDAGFRESGRCAGARVYVFEDNDGFRVAISKPDPKRRISAVAEETGERELLEFHPEGFDVLSYREASGELLANTKLKHDLALYMRVLGDLVFGNPDVYSSRSIAACFTLMPLINDRENCLKCRDVPDMSEVRLTALCISRAPALSIVTRHTSKTDLFKELAQGGDTIPRNASPTSATFRVAFKDGRETSVRITVPNKAAISQDADHDTICEFLRRRGFLLAPQES